MKTEKKAELFFSALHKVMTEEIGEANVDLTEDFTAMLLSVKGAFVVLTGNDEIDLIDFTHTLNKLAVQYIFSEEED